MKVKICNRSSIRLHQELFQDLKSQEEWYKNANKDTLIRVSIETSTSRERTLEVKFDIASAKWLHLELRKTFVMRPDD